MLNDEELNVKENKNTPSNVLYKPPQNFGSLPVEKNNYEKLNVLTPNYSSQKERNESLPLLGSHQNYNENSENERSVFKSPMIITMTCFSVALYLVIFYFLAAKKR